jgi:hypothetical protein
VSLALGPIIDYLVAQATTAVSAITVNEVSVAVSDGPYDDPTFGMLVVGLAEPIEGSPTRPTVVNRQALTLGLPMNLSEQADIPCFIDVRIPGTQKQARDQAEAIFNAFNNVLLTDPSAGGLISGGMAFVTAVEASPSRVGTPAEAGHRYFISFTVRCTDITR